MSHKSKISGAEKIVAVERYLRGEDSRNHLATLLDVACKFMILYQYYLSFS
jgi:transposase